jgi:hypothetical protein
MHVGTVVRAGQRLLGGTAMLHLWKGRRKKKIENDKMGSTCQVAHLIF